MDPFLSSLLVRLRHQASASWTRASDAELLGRFARSRDDAAFELLFWRHGPLVWSVCRRLLGTSPDAEDAFQATFVVLARKAKSIGDGSAVAGWLHQVAWRAALNARKARARRTAHEALAAQCRQHADNCTPHQQLEDQELQVVVDKEIASLPIKFRMPLILCDLQGRSRASAAAELQCSLGTINSRLARGREKLKARLLQRGLALPTLAVATLPADLALASLETMSKQRSAAVSALAQGVIRSMALATAMRLAGALTVLCLLAGGIAWGTRVDVGNSTPTQPLMLVLEGQKVDRVNFIDPGSGPLPRDAVARIGSTRFRHDADVSKLAYSPDGKWLASMSYAPSDATARLWDAATGREKLRVKLALDGPQPLLQPPYQGPSALGFTGNQFLVLDTASMRSFDIATGKELFNHPHPGLGKTKAEAKAKGPKQRYPLQAGAIAPDGKSYVLSWIDGSLEVYDMTSGAVRKKGLHPFIKYGGVQVQYSPDSRRFLLNATLEEVPIYDAASAEQISVVSIKDKLFLHAFLLPGSDVLVGHVSEERGVNPILAFFDIKTGKLVRRLDGDWTTSALAIAPDGKAIVAGSALQPFSKVVDLETGKLIARIQMEYSTMVLAYSPSSSTLAGAFFGGSRIGVWDVQKGVAVDASAEPVTFAGTVFSRDGQKVAVGWTRDIVDWRTGQLVRRLPDVATNDGPREPILAPNQMFFVVLEKNRSIRLVDATSGKDIRVIADLKATALRAQFSQDSRRLVSYCADNELRVWDLANGREIAAFAPSEELNQPGLALSDNGRLLTVTAWGQGKNAVHVLYTWHIDDIKLLSRIEVPGGRLIPTAVSPDGRYLATGSSSKDRTGNDAESEVVIWNTASGRKLKSLPGHQFDRGYRSCAFSSNSQLLFTGDATGRLRVWEVLSGQEMYAFEGHRQKIYWTTCSPDGRFLLTASDDAPCFIWDIFGMQSIPKFHVVASDLWRDLADQDTKKAFLAMKALAVRPALTVVLIGKELKPDTAVDDAKIEKLLEDLDSPKFSVRDAAMTDLAAIADRLQPALTRARAGASLEIQRRIDRLLERAAQPGPQRLRESRAVGVLEIIATPAATKLLQEYAAGSRHTALAAEAAAAVSRLKALAAK
jgi:RNA polymerase sigma factor (sigma-70 family)